MSTSSLTSECNSIKLDYNLNNDSNENTNNYEMLYYYATSEPNANMSTIDLDDPLVLVNSMSLNTSSSIDSSSSNFSNMNNTLQDVAVRVSATFFVV